MFQAQTVVIALGRGRKLLSSGWARLCTDFRGG